MTDFTNETIDTLQIPKFETVAFLKLEASYWKVKLIYFGITFLISAIILAAALFNIEDFYPYRFESAIGLLLIFVSTLLLQRIGFKKKAFAFRQHDVIFRFGIISTNTIIIPYNRVQHVATHEDFVSRYFGLIKLEIFTAGESSSDIDIRGLKKEHAENIKQLLVSKIENQL
jgi:membrane protein YdbS with pleckstrin-like domain